MSRWPGRGFIIIIIIIIIRGAQSAATDEHTDIQDLINGCPVMVGVSKNQFA